MVIQKIYFYKGKQKMKKLPVLFLVIFSSIFLLSGCAKYSYNFYVTEKGLKIEEIKAFDISKFEEKRSLLENAIERQTSGNNKDYLLEKYSDYPYLGIKKTKEDVFAKISNKDLPAGFSTPLDNIVDREDNIFGRVYRINLYFRPEIVKADLEKISEKALSSNYAGINEIEKVPGSDKNYKVPEEDVTNYESEEALNRQNLSLISSITPKYELKITLPKKAKSHNAQIELANNEYYWELSPDSESEIYIEYAKNDFGTLGCIIIVLFLTIVAYHYYRKFTHEDDD